MNYLIEIIKISVNDTYSKIYFGAIMEINFHRCDATASVSMMNRICSVETSNSLSKKKSRLEALAASRDRELGPDTDSGEEMEESAKGIKSKAARKLSRSLPSKSKIIEIFNITVHTVIKNVSGPAIPVHNYAEPEPFKNDAGLKY
jgi:hypothetical protein